MTDSISGVSSSCDIRSLINPGSRLNRPNAATRRLHNNGTSTMGGGHLRKHGIRLNSALVLEKRRIYTSADQRPQHEASTNHQSSKILHQRIKAQSAPPGRLRTLYTETPNDETGVLSRSVKTSLAAYSPQSQRFNIDRLTEIEKIRMRIKQSQIKSHRVDKRFFLLGKNCNVLDRYQIDKEQNRLLTEFLEKKREQSSSKRVQFVTGV